jgi:hypothetical protein
VRRGRDAVPAGQHAERLQGAADVPVDRAAVRSARRRVPRDSDGQRGGLAGGVSARRGRVFARGERVLRRVLYTGPHATASAW